MNTQLAEQEQVDPMDHALALTIAAFDAVTAANNASIDQSNAQVDELERLRDELSFTKMQLKTSHGRINTLVEEKSELSKTIEADNAIAKNVAKGQFEIIENAKKCLQQEKQAKLELEQAKLTVTDLRLEVKRLKEEGKDFKTIASTPAKMRKKLSLHKDNIQRHKGFAAQHKLNLGKADTEIFKLKKSNMALCHKIAVSDLIEIYAYGDYLLCLFPHQLGDIPGYKKDQVPLLCLHKGGRSSVLLLDEEGKISIPAAPAGGFKPAKPLLEHAENFMSRIESQGWAMSDADIRSLNMQHLAAA